jgi:pyruvate/2-oxoglutarate dehydrogenase complex dihydrolipoamide dehydrogenase (E3) component
MPTKALLFAAEIGHSARRGATWGVQAENVGFNFPQVMARKDAMVKDFADYRQEQLASGKFKFIRANARFRDAHTLALSTGETLTAKNFVISTGSIVSAPPLPFLKDLNYITSDEALALTSLPKSLIILGGGSVAVEFAQFFARLDVKVTLIQRSAQVMNDFDTDAAVELEKVFRREGVNVFTGTKITSASRQSGRKQISFQHGPESVTVEAEEVLFALGRSPNTASLDLDKAGVKTENGRVVTNDEMRTSAAHIFAAGDCTATHDIVHIAVLQGEAAAHNITQPQKSRRMDYRLMTVIAFTDPQIARAGLTEKAARAQKIPYLSAKHLFADHGKSLIMEAREGFVKLLANPATGEIIGGGCAGPLGGELIHEIIAAMHKRMTVAELAAMPHYHPTLAEIWTYPAEELAEKIRG